MKKGTVFLSVIIPVFNESKRLHNLKKIYHFFKNQNYLSEIVVINDGSSDKTLNHLKKMSQSLDFKIISYPKNYGKGYAVKQGMLNSQGLYKLFTDIDLSTPIETINKFLPHSKKYELVIGSRKTVGSNLIKRQPLFRELMGRGFTLLSQKTLGVKVSDFTCGFKLFSATAAENIFPKLTINRWGFDSEVLFLAAKYNLKIKEIPVFWMNDADSRVTIFKDSLVSLKELMTIFINNLQKRY